MTMANRATATRAQHIRKGRFAVLLVALMALCAPAHAQLGTTGVGPADDGVFTASCSQSATYLAAVSGLSVTERNAYDAAICGIVSDGNFSVIDGMYFYANASAANARVNVAAPGTHNLTTYGSCTFTVDVGFTGDGATCYQDPGVNPSTAGGNYTQNSAMIGHCILNARTTPNTSDSSWGSTDGTSFIYYDAFFTGSVAVFDLQGTGSSQAISSAQGSWIVTRLNSSGGSFFLNGADLQDYSTTSGTLPNANLFGMGFNGSGTASNWTTDQLGYWFFGGARSAGGVTAIYNRLHTMMAALGNSAC
jgi:hypothetical protein